MLALLFIVARLGSVTFALGLAGLIAVFGIFVFATRKRPGRRYDKKAPSRADADMQTWDWSP